LYGWCEDVSHFGNTTSTLTGLSLRPGEPRDAEACGRIFWEAFASIASQHSFPIEPGVPEFTNWKATQMLSDPGFVATVAESEGEIVGSVFVDVRAPILGVGPVTVDPAFQDGGVGRYLMEHVLSDAKARGSAGVRLVQTAYHYRSLSLYAKLGFQVREPLSVMQGEIQDDSPLASEVRPASPSDIDACNELCILVHGHERNGELRDAISEGSAVVAERGGHLTGYATGVGYGWHAVGETNEEAEQSGLVGRLGYLLIGPARLTQALDLLVGDAVGRLRDRAGEFQQEALGRI